MEGGGAGEGFYVRLGRSEQTRSRILKSRVHPSHGRGPIATGAAMGLFAHKQHDQERLVRGGAVSSEEAVSRLGQQQSDRLTAFREATFGRSSVL
jgi:hypothetical protein